MLTLSVPRNKLSGCASKKAVQRSLAPARDSAHRPASGWDRERAATELGNQAMLRRAAAERAIAGSVQFKLTIGAVNDPLEQEADRVADHVMRMSGPDAAISTGAPRVIRKCAACEEEEAGTVHRTAATASGAQLEDPTESVQGVLSSPGMPLDASARAFFEPRFGMDFSRVRVHADEQAAESSRGLGALAYATGQHIVFAAGRYDPRSTPGRRLIAHELAHTVQQGGGRPITGSGSAVARPAAAVQTMIQRTGECDGLKKGSCRGGCVPADGRGTGFCAWSGSIATGCICYRRDQPMLRAVEQALFNLIVAALIAAGIVLTAAAIAAIVACLLGPCEAAALIGALGAAGAAIVMGFIGKKDPGAAGGPSSANDPSAGGGAAPDAGAAAPA